MNYAKLLLFTSIAALLSLTGCSKEFYGGAAAGAVGAGAAYEYGAHRSMEDLEEDYKAGKIDRAEYERRKEEIEKRSIIK